MKIFAINSRNSQYFYQKRNLTNNNINSSPISQNQQSEFYYPQNYQPFFGARLNRSPQNFYAQKFNIENMPLTVKNYLYSDFQKNSLKPPALLQKEAFDDLNLCESAADVKELYPNEPLFSELKSLDEISPRRGFLYDLKILQDDDNRVLKSREDLTMYLLKKIYLEGKDIEEINEDFRKDANPVFLDEENYSQNGYFQYTTLKALGIKFPHTSYWHSFLATRADKKYVYVQRTIDTTKERKSPVISQEQKFKQSERMINYWASLTPEQRAKRIEKLRENLPEQDSLFLQYISPIMIIAADKAKLSEKMVEFYRKYSISEYLPEDISNLNKSQHIILKKFWDENPQVKKEFSKAIIETIDVFKSAQENGKIDELLSAAEKIKMENEHAALLRKMSSVAEIKKIVKEGVEEHYKFYPDIFVQSYVEFLYKHPKFNNDFVPLYQKAVYATDEQKDKYHHILQQILYSLSADFINTHKLESNAADMAVMSVIYPLLTNQMKFIFNSDYIIALIKNKNLGNYVKSNKPKINEKMQIYTAGFSDVEMKNVCEFFVTLMKDIGRNGYRTLENKQAQARARLLTKMAKQIENNKFYRNKFKDFIKNYEPQIRYATEPTTAKHIKLYLMESILDDATRELADKK